MSSQRGRWFPLWEASGSHSDFYDQDSEVTIISIISCWLSRAPSVSEEPREREFLGQGSRGAAVEAGCHTVFPILASLLGDNYYLTTLL